MCRLAQKNFLEKKCEEAKGDSAKLWKVAKSAMNMKPKPNITPDFIKSRTDDGKLKKIDNDTDIANEMNRQFAGMGAKLANDLQTTRSVFTDFLQHPNPNTERIILHTVTESRVDELIQELDTSKSISLDEISPLIVKWGAPVLVPILAKFYNKCVVGGIYPDRLKLARVIPIFKGGNKNDASSYRPISILFLASNLDFGQKTRQNIQC